MIVHYHRHGPRCACGQEPRSSIATSVDEAQVTCQACKVVLALPTWRGRERDLQAGSRVEHRTYGSGEVVVVVDAARRRERVAVAVFDRVGRKVVDASELR
jgi:hypothetical protein